jgi:hypothetical protein
MDKDGKRVLRTCTANMFSHGVFEPRPVLYTGSACVLVSVTRASVRRREADALTELSASAERELLKVLNGCISLSACSNPNSHHAARILKVDAIP